VQNLTVCPVLQNLKIQLYVIAELCHINLFEVLFWSTPYISTVHYHAVQCGDRSKYVDAQRPDTLAAISTKHVSYISLFHVGTQEEIALPKQLLVVVVADGLPRLVIHLRSARYSSISGVIAG